VVEVVVCGGQCRDPGAVGGQGGDPVVGDALVALVQFGDGVGAVVVEDLDPVAVRGRHPAVRGGVGAVGGGVERGGDLAGPPVPHREGAGAGDVQPLPVGGEGQVVGEPQLRVDLLGGERAVVQGVLVGAGRGAAALPAGGLPGAGGGGGQGGERVAASADQEQGGGRRGDQGGPPPPGGARGCRAGFVLSAVHLLADGGGQPAAVRGGGVGQGGEDRGGVRPLGGVLVQAAGEQVAQGAFGDGGVVRVFGEDAVQDGDGVAGSERGAAAGGEEHRPGEGEHVAGG